MKLTITHYCLKTSNKEKLGYPKTFDLTHGKVQESGNKSITEIKEKRNPKTSN